ncbi:hypothetical protein KIN20_035430 [Parelaphostrongylus tenuis]|uniref:Uncharacterized protein n=1 Tax=Parelaphostrongylus tenuis TaxID=148309 RepID=A0AAD5RBT7_PARTN|nr:hypothetical protein KIN20_035430 [Parelaphostrongylus tenuis]
MKLQTEAPKPEWSKEAVLTADRPQEAADTKTEVISEEKPNLGARILDTAKGVARQLWQKKKETCCILPQNNVLLSEKCCIGRLLHVQQIKEKLTRNGTREVEKM